jgi:RNA polymerase sigma factor for flagellar operon FliA
MTTEEQILALQPVVKRIAGQMLRSFPPCVHLGDLVSVANIAIIKALPRFDPNKRTSVKTFLRRRIRGAILDYLREEDPVTRDTRKTAKRIDFAFGEVARLFGRAPGDEEVATKMRVPLAKLNRWLRQLADQGIEIKERQMTANRHFLPSDEPHSHWLSPLDFACQQENKQQVRQMLARLPRRQANILVSLYWNEMTQAQLAAQMNLDESRICQIHRDALGRLGRILQPAP